MSSGVRLTIKDGAVSSVTLNGKTIDPDAIYKVCTIDYLVESGRYAFDENIYRLDSVDYIYDLFCNQVKKAAARGEQVQASIDDRVSVI